MASEGRIPSHNIRHPLPGPGAMHHDPYNLAIRPPPGSFPHFEMFLPPEIMEQKLSAQHFEISKLAKENQRLAVSHETLRQDIGTVNKELQLVHSHIAEMKSEKGKQTKGVMDKMSMMEGELKGAETVKMELQKAHAEAQGLASTRQELISNVQSLTRDLQIAHGDAQQIPVLMSELVSLRQEYQHARGTYEYEKKLYNEHLESLQVMEKNYMEMSREVENLRAELTNYSNFDPQTGGQYSGYSGYGNSYPMGNYASGQNAYPVAQVSRMNKVVKIHILGCPCVREWPKKESRSTKTKKNKLAPLYRRSARSGCADLFLPRAAARLDAFSSSKAPFSSLLLHQPQNLRPLHPKILPQNSIFILSKPFQHPKSPPNPSPTMEPPPLLFQSP